MSFRTERSVVKNLESIHVYVTEILRFALNDICFLFTTEYTEFH